jgi:glycosyltransferase involved in cell wall biosynthesis
MYGADRAAYRIHRALCEHASEVDLHSMMRVMNKTGDDPSVTGGPPLGQSSLWRHLHPRLSRLSRWSFRTANPSLHSCAWPSTGLAREIQNSYHRRHVDLLHLHWLGNSTLSIEEIGHLRLPSVWTLHDQWTFCGAEHYTMGALQGAAFGSDMRFLVGYSPESRPAYESGKDINRHTWLRKHRAWRRPIQIVCPSRWLADCVKRSALTSEWPMSIIPHPLNLNVWSPCEQMKARDLLRLPLDCPLVLFGADRGTADPRKGADLLFDAMRHLHSEQSASLDQLQLVVFGQGRPADVPNLGFSIHYAGRLHDDISLRLLYSAADLMVVPSRQEAFGQTASEAHACGTPVVAFRACGLMDIVDDRRTGALAEPFDPVSLAAAIRWVLEDPVRLRQLRAAARQRAERLWDPARIARLYADVYAETIERHDAALASRR